MDKYAVEVDQEKVDEADKTANVEKTCPKCGENLIQEDANIPRCPVHGSKPFECQTE